MSIVSVRVFFPRSAQVVDEILLDVVAEESRGASETARTGRRRERARNPTSVVSVDAQLASCFCCEIRRSAAYRRAVIRHWFDPAVQTGEQAAATTTTTTTTTTTLGLRLYLYHDRRLPLDARWSDRLQRLVNLRIELDYLASWLSTLGGAFSALGDIYERCALVAGKISYHQWRLATYCDDPLAAAKCKIFAAVSLVQRGHFRLGARLVRQQYDFAKSLPANAKDKRLENMCFGVWAKLKYLRSVRHRQPQKGCGQCRVTGEG